MILRICIFLTLLLASRELLAQDTRHAAFIDRVTDTISYVGVLKCESVSRYGYTPRQYMRFDSLRKQCSSAELQALLSHKSPVVRAYAFWALAERPEVDLYPLLLQHRRDTKEFAQQCGCIGTTQTVVDAMFHHYQKSVQYSRDTLAVERRIGLEKMEKQWSKRFDRDYRKQRHMSWPQRRRLIHKYKQLRAHDQDDF